jgi:hypothetical protein
VTMSFDEPERVTIEAFGHTFRDLLVGNAEDLRTLEKEGAIYANFTDRGSEHESLETFARYRIQLAPAEIFEYVEAHLAQQEFYEALNRTNDFTAAVVAISNEKYRKRVVEYGDYGTRETASGGSSDNRGCIASFLGPELEELTCGYKRNRYEAMPELGDTSNRNELVVGCLKSIDVASRRLANRSHGRPPITMTSEYDIQDLAETILRGVFTDLVREEWTPKNAGNAKRIDLVIPSPGAIIECKYVRDISHARRIADELRVDFETYHEYPGCKNVYVYAHDPGGHIADSEQFSVDLSGIRRKRDHEFSVLVLVGH